MDKPKHTPGPWAYGKVGRVTFGVVGPVEATREGSTIQRNIADNIVMEANAALIASAPELLEALKKVQALILEFGPEDDMAREQASTLYRVIAKAEGRSHE